MALSFAAPAVRRFSGDFWDPLLLQRPFGYHHFLPAKPGMQWLPLCLRREFAPLWGLWEWLRARTLDERLAARALRRPLHPFFFCWAFFRCAGFFWWFAHQFRAASAIDVRAAVAGKPATANSTATVSRPELARVSRTYPPIVYTPPGPSHAARSSLGVRTRPIPPGPRTRTSRARRAA